MDSNNTIHKINQTRYNLKKYLSDEWNVSEIKDYSDSEIDQLYRSNNSINENLAFGSAAGCNLSLNHKDIPSHKLHIIYYNFPDIGKPPIKVTKTCSDKIDNLYKSESIAPEDSLIIILYNKIPINLETSIDKLFNTGQENMLVNGLSDDIKKENINTGNKYTYSHFLNIHLYELNSLSIDILQHRAIPDHKCIRDKDEIDKILSKSNATINQMPIIFRNDPISKRLRLSIGDMCEITRITKTGGEIKYYRVCK